MQLPGRAGCPSITSASLPVAQRACAPARPAAMAAAVMVIHTYYGFTATGGPAGVGEAVGRAVRTSVTATVFVLLTITLAVYGQSGNFHLSG